VTKRGGCSCKPVGETSMVEGHLHRRGEIRQKRRKAVESKERRGKCRGEKERQEKIFVHGKKKKRGRKGGGGEGGENRAIEEKKFEANAANSKEKGELSIATDEESFS